MKRAITADDVATIMGMSAAHVRRHYRTLHGIKVGDTYRFPADVYDRLMPKPVSANVPECEHPQSASTHGPTAPIASGGESPASKKKNADTQQRTRRSHASSKSAASFATRFPEDAAKLGQYAS